jgi:hypothetical protein
MGLFLELIWYGGQGGPYSPIDFIYFVNPLVYEILARGDLTFPRSG